MSAGVWAANETTGARSTASAGQERDRSILVVAANTTQPTALPAASAAGDGSGNSSQPANVSPAQLTFRPAPSLGEREPKAPASDAVVTTPAPTREQAVRRPIMPSNRPSSFAPPRLQIANSPAPQPNLAPATTAPALNNSIAASPDSIGDATCQDEPGMADAEAATEQFIEMGESLQQWSESTVSQLQAWFSNSMSPEMRQLADAQRARNSQPIKQNAMIEGIEQGADAFRSINLGAATIDAFASIRSAMSEQIAGTPIAANWNESKQIYESSEAQQAQAISHRSSAQSSILWFADLLDQAGDELKEASQDLENWACDAEDETCITE